MLTRRSWLVYGALVAVWAILLGWQVAEHVRVERADKTRLINRANVESDTLALLVKSLNRYGVINSNALKSALEDLVNLRRN